LKLSGNFAKLHHNIDKCIQEQERCDMNHKGW